MFKRKPSGKRRKTLYASDQMQHFEQLTLRQFATRYNIPVERLKYAVDAGYLKLVKDRSAYTGYGDIVAEVPSPSVAIWLKQMLKPLALRPLLRWSEIAAVLGMQSKQLRAICAKDKRIKTHYDPAFGELITPRMLYFVLQNIPKSHGLPSFDRGRMLQFLTGTQYGIKMKFQVLPYSRQIDRECKRIAHLPQPYRTIRAIAIHEAMQDAKNIVDCLRIYKESAEREEVKLAEGSVKRLLKQL